MDNVLNHVQAMVNQENEEQGFEPDMVAQALVLTVCYDAKEGTKYYRVFKSSDLRIWEALGLINFQRAQLEADITEAYVNGDS